MKMSIAGLQNALIDLVAEIEIGMSKKQIRQRLIELAVEVE